MERFQEARDKARHHIRVADHMVFVTYPLVKDNKILLAVVENLFLAMTNAMASVLHYERLFKKVPPFHDNYESKLNLFRERCMDRYAVAKEHIKVMEELKDIIIEHKRSPIEFTRKDNLVICSDTYFLRTVSIHKIKEFTVQAKGFVAWAEAIVSRNEAITG